MQVFPVLDKNILMIEANILFMENVFVKYKFNIL